MAHPLRSKIGTMGMSARARGAIGICGLFLAVATIEAGCGDDSFTSTASTDGGDDAVAQDASGDAASEDAGTEAGAACISAATPGAKSAQPFCDAYAAVASRCLDCDPCWQQNANACEGLADALSVAIRDGFVACASQISCVAFEDQIELVSDPCIQAFIADAGATTAQVGARDAYCANCTDGGADNVEACDEAYFGTGGDAGIGLFTLLTSDTVSDNIASSCQACDGFFYSYPFGCSKTQFCNTAGSDACKKGICK